eukprot:3341277-Amphidinium_carterae.1
MLSTRPTTDRPRVAVRDWQAGFLDCVAEYSKISSALTPDLYSLVVDFSSNGAHAISKSGRVTLGYVAFSGMASIVLALRS